MGSTLRFRTVCCRTVGKNRHRLRKNAARHFHLLHTHQGSSAQLVVPARIGAPPSRLYDAAGRACCDAATRLNNPKASPSQALSRTTKHPHRPSSSKLHPSLPRPPSHPPPRPPRSKDPSKGSPWTPREGEEGTKVEGRGGGGREGGEGASPIFFTEDNCKAIC